MSEEPISQEIQNQIYELSKKITAKKKDDYEWELRTKFYSSASDSAYKLFVHLDKELQRLRKVMLYSHPDIDLITNVSNCLLGLEHLIESYTASYGYEQKELERKLESSE